MIDSPVLVLGLGNVLCSDDGAGVVAVERLRARYELPAGVTVFDGGTLGLSLLPYVRTAERLLLIDAVAAKLPPGALLLLEDDEVPAAVVERLSVHQVGVADLLMGARLLGSNPRRITLAGIVPQSLALGVGLSPAVERGIEDLVDLAAHTCGRFGFPLHQKGARHERDAHRSGDDWARRLSVS